MTDAARPVRSVRGAIRSCFRIARLMQRRIALETKKQRLKQRIDESVGRQAREIETLMAAESDRLAMYTNMHRHELAGTKTSAALGDAGTYQWSEGRDAVIIPDSASERAIAQELERMGRKDCLNYRPEISRTELKKPENRDLVARLQKKGFDIKIDAEARQIICFPNTKWRMIRRLTDAIWRTEPPRN